RRLELAVWRTEPSRTSNTPYAASSLNVRARASGCTSAFAATSATERGRSSIWSAIPSSATTCNARGSQLPAAICITVSTGSRDGVLAAPAVELIQLLVRQPRVSLCDRQQLALVPHREGHVGENVRAAAISGLRVHEHGVDRVRIDLPLPPVAARPPAPVRRVAALEHQSFHRTLARLAAERTQCFPRGARYLLGEHEPRAAARDQL